MSTNTLEHFIQEETVHTGTPDAQKELPPNWEARIQRMKSKEDQIADYGVERWSNDFVRLSSIETLPGINLEGEALRNEIWRKLPNSKFRRFQEAFCKLEDFIIRPPMVVAGEIFYPRTLYPQLRSVKGCLPDVDNVPDALLANLGLFNGDEIDVEDDLSLIEAKYAALPSLKKAYEATVQIAPKNLRMLVLQRPWESINKQYPDVSDIDEEVVGSILYSREYPRGKYDPVQERKTGKIPQRQVFSFFPDVYRAFSKTKRQSRNYERRETPLLATLFNDLKILNQRFQDEWVAGVGDDVKDTLIAEGMALIERVEVQLRNCTQRYKVRIYEMLVSMKPTLEARRSSPAMAKMIGAVNAIEDRREDIDPKGGYNSRDAAALHTVITQNQDLLRRVRGNVKEGAARVGMNLELYSEHATEAVINATINRIKRDLCLPRHASDLLVRPFSTYVEILNALSVIVEEKLRAKDKQGAKHAVINMHVIGKFQAAHTCIEHLKAAISDPQIVSMTRVITLTQRITEVFEGREVFPDETPIHLAEVYEPVDHALHALGQLVQEAGPNIETDTEMLQKFCQQMQQQLDAFDMERITRDFAHKAMLETEE